MDNKKKKYISAEEALARLQRYCAYQDRCHQEVRNKLIELGIYGDALENIIAELISENFLNELRFAQSYARGKFYHKKWGRIRIRMELKKRRISAYCLKKAMAEINDTDYREMMEKLLLKKDKTLRETNPYKRNKKLAAFLVQKGYETHLTWELIKQLFPIR